ncbi:hypothetical protein [Streptomyces sp. NPDC056361]|uniref:hypothetical protein n=1 Tax=Streptomyces sp. NPDC056361 TaxID=3345795 RepID=UPI0035DF57A7
MSVPKVIPIRHEPDYRTSTIGRWQGGQFFASVTAAFAEGWSGDDWQSHKRWCAVLHHFDDNGRHLTSRIEFTGTTADGENTSITTARRLLAEWLDALPDRRYQDIAIAPFAVRAEGVLFGLVLEKHEESIDDCADADADADADVGVGMGGDAGGDEYGSDDVDGVWAEFYPDGLGFSAPWDGEYDT